MNVKNTTVPLLCLLLLACNTQSPPSDSISKIESISIKNAFYPANFHPQLQQNLDYFIDDIGVSSETLLPFDNIKYRDSSFYQDTYTNITTVGLYINLLIEMYRNGDNKALTRLEQTMTRLENLDHWNGLYYWLYRFDGAKVKPAGNGIVSSVDNGNLAFSLATLVGASLTTLDLKPIAARAQSILDGQAKGWYQLYDSDKNLLRSGYNTYEDKYLGYHVDRKSNESRLASIWAILITKNNINQKVPNSSFTDMPLIQGRYTTF